MTIVITILVIILAPIALVLIVALFVKKEYSIQRDVIINKPNTDVFNYVKHLKNQDNFSKWVMIDPSMKKVFTGTDGTVGFIYAWDSENKNAGKGEQEIKNILEGERLDVEVRFERPFAGIASTPFIVESLPSNKTNVRWGMHGKNKYPMNITNLFMPNILGKDLDISLNTLKAILEKQ